jgi:dihydrofolate synthase/folylpolyglutamate synthase
VALFTSPHLVDIRERFVISGRMISKEAFLQAFQRIYDLLDWEALEKGEAAYHPTYFEFLFFIAMLVFAEENPDYCILETGLGGRLDATNSVAKKELSVITHISLDHVEYLGDTVEKIAREKAGIMQAGAPAVYWDTCRETTAVFEKKAGELGISAYPVSKNSYRFSNFHHKTIAFSLYTGYYGYISLTLNTIAAYQMENASLAVHAALILDRAHELTVRQIQDGVRDCFWAGRMEEVLPEVYLDGAHNEDGIRAFLETVASDGHAGKRSLLFGVVKDKDYVRMVDELVRSGLFERFAIAHMQTGRGLDEGTLKALFEKYPGCRYEAYDDVASAFCGLMRDRGEGERVYAAGSLYLVGEIKELLEDDKFRGRTEKISSEP